MSVYVGPKELELLASMAGQPGRVFGVREASAVYGSVAAARKALSRLRSKGLLTALERDRYVVVPLEAGPERAWSEDSLVIGSNLVAGSAIAYWSALHYWNLTEQVPGTVFVQTTARRHNPEPVIAGVRYRFVRVAEAKYYGLLTRRSGDRPFGITDPEKTLVDALDRPDLSGGLATVIGALEAARPNWRRLEAHLERFPSAGPLRRLGHLLEREVSTEGLEAAWLERLATRVPRGIVLLDPGLAKSGPIDRRWGVQSNGGTTEYPGRTTS